MPFQANVFRYCMAEQSKTVFYGKYKSKYKKVGILPIYEIRGLNVSSDGPLPEKSE